MNEDTQALNPGEEVLALPADETVALPAPDEDQDLPAGYEVVASAPGALQSQVESAEEFGDELISVQAVIRRYSEQQDKLNGEIKEIRESLRNMFSNDEELQKMEAQQKAASTDVKQKKQRIKESPEAVQLQMKMKERLEEMGEIQQSLSNHLLRYFQMTGSQVIEEPDGGEREFSVKARLKGKKRTE